MFTRVYLLLIHINLRPKSALGGASHRSLRRELGGIGSISFAALLELHEQLQEGENADLVILHAIPHVPSQITDEHYVPLRHALMKWYILVTQAAPVLLAKHDVSSVMRLGRDADNALSRIDLVSGILPGR